MPVWHAKTKALVESGELAVVGIVHEQHPDRAALYAQWQQFDFPLLWDPFGVTGLEVVPVVSAIDASGVVRLGRLDPRKFDSQFIPEFMEASFPATTPARPAGFVVSELVKAGSAREQAMARVLLEGVQEKPFGPENQAGLGALMDAPSTPYEQFCAGVAHRLRYDSAAAQPDDFQSALTLWSEALHARPGQYIWRRRIQQWGPRLDKPYPFYDWVGKATLEVWARDDSPVQLRAMLSGSEVAGKTKRLPGSRSGKAADGASPEPVEPDPRGELPRDVGEIVGLELAVAQHTASAGGSMRSPVGSSRVHVTLRPKAGAKWPLDADPPMVWLGLPDGWNAASSSYRFPMPVEGQETAPLLADFEISTQPIPLGPPDESAAMPASVLPAYAVYSVCLEDGTCVFRRQDFQIKVTFPAMPDMGPPPEADGDGDGNGKD
ncbi:MAG: hypothetical protein ACJAZN_002089 [Planctomycetota bacterium]